MIRILRRQATPGEREFFGQWLEESDSHKEEYAAITLLWDRMEQGSVPPVPDADHIWQQIETRIASSSPSNILPLSVPQMEEASPSRSRSRFRTVAAFAPLAAAMIAGFTLLFPRDAIEPPAAPATAYAPAMREVVTRRGERINVPLSDGSVVFLNAGSSLRFPAVFGSASREVELKGEGFFTVRGDARRPFRVNTGSACTEVKGTEFNVRFRRNRVEVAVAKGAVRLLDRNRHAEIDLVRGESSVYRDAVGFSRPRKIDLRRVMAWRESRLAFDKTPLSDVMSEIELFYNVHVEFRNTRSMQNTLTGFFASDSLDAVLSSIALAMDVKIARNGQTVIVY